jgi:hypothetical protein
MEMSKNLLLSAATSTLLVFGCKKEDITRDEKAKETFPIEYRFINNGDANVRDVVFYTTTFYPGDSISRSGDTTSTIYWYNRAFHDVGTNDTIRHQMDKPGYKECTTYLKVLVHFKSRMFSQIWANRNYYSGDSTTLGMIISRMYSSDTAIINSTSDRIVTFHWPSDTLKYTEVIR